MTIINGMNLSPASLKLYLSNLKRLNAGNEPLTLEFLKDESKILDKIAKGKPNTQRSYLISIIALLKQEPESELLCKYQKYLKNLNSELKEAPEEMVSQEEVKAAFKKLDVSSFTNSKLSEIEYNTLSGLLILSLYTFLPYRNPHDYLKLLKLSKFTSDIDNEFNYLTDTAFYFRKGKKTDEVEIPEEVKSVLELFYQHHPLSRLFKKAPVPLLVNHLGIPYYKPSTFTKVLSSIFERKINPKMIPLFDKVADDDV